MTIFKTDLYKAKIVFIHIPKNAGTSIGNILGINNPSHKKAYEIEKERGKYYLKRNFSFSVVRNPFSRFLSLYNYARMEISYYHNNVEPHKSQFGKHLDFELLKNASIKECAYFLKEGKLKHDKAWNHWMPQYTWLYNKKGKKCLIKNIYKLEELNVLRRDLEKQGCIISSFPKLNFSLADDYNLLMDHETREIIKEYYKKDFEFFNYRF